MPQESIIDSIKKTIIFKKRFVIKNKNKICFNYLLLIASKLFSHNFTINSWRESFKYSYIDKNREKKKVNYFVEECSKENKKIVISRKSKEGLYTTTLESLKNKIYYFETIVLKEPPFQIWGQVGKYIFKKGFKKRVKLIKGELSKYE